MGVSACWPYESVRGPSQSSQIACLPHAFSRSSTAAWDDWGVFSGGETAARLAFPGINGGNGRKEEIFLCTPVAEPEFSRLRFDHFTNSSSFPARIGAIVWLVVLSCNVFSSSLRTPLDFPVQNRSSRHGSQLASKPTISRICAESSAFVPNGRVSSKSRAFSCSSFLHPFETPLRRLRSKQLCVLSAYRVLLCALEFPCSGFSG